jgi:hypothetical protein
VRARSISGDPSISTSSLGDNINQYQFSSEVVELLRAHTVSTARVFSLNSPLN